jgi:hypothetical protein
MNLNSIKSAYAGTGRGTVPALTGIGTTETAFSVTTDTGTTVLALTIPTGTEVLGSGAGLRPGNNKAILTMPYGANSQVPNVSDRPFFSSTSFEGRPLVVRVAGTFTSAVASNDLKIGLYLGTSATLGSDLAISSITTGTSGNFGAVSGHFLAEFKFIWDSTSGKLDGIVETGLIGPSGVTPTVTALAATTQVAAATVSTLSFIPSAKWNASNAGNTVSITDFSIDLV